MAMKIHKWSDKWLVLLILFAVILRLAGLPWGFFHGDLFEPDEGQHVMIAKSLINSFDKKFIDDASVVKQWYPRGFGTQIAVLGYLPLKLLKLDPNYLFGVGRVLSLAYSILLIILVYHISLHIFKNRKIAFISSLLLSIFDLNITYSHYGLPDIGTVFWSYLSAFLIFLMYQKLSDKKEPIKEIFYSDKCLFLGVPLSIAMAFSFKLDLIPLLLFFGSFFALLFVKKRPFKDLFYLFLVFIFLIISFFYISVGFNQGLGDLIELFRPSNFNAAKAIPADNSYMYKPITSFFAVAAGTSFPIIVLFVLSLFYLFSDKKPAYGAKKANIFFMIFLSLELILLWGIATSFVRRANIFLPFISILAGYGLYTLIISTENWRTRHLGLILAVFIVAYTLSITLVSQSNFIFETRYDAEKYLESFKGKDCSFAYSYYAKTRGMPDGSLNESLDTTADIIVMHEAYYSRYWKYFSTPFKIPKCCDEVYHCNFEDCIFIQNLMSGKTEYQLSKSFRTKKILPERLIFYGLFGTYETFQGDVLIFSKKNMDEGCHV